MQKTFDVIPSTIPDEWKIVVITHICAFYNCEACEPLISGAPREGASRPVPCPFLNFALINELSFVPFQKSALP